jgi:hypothetical protein
MGARRRGRGRLFLLAGLILVSAAGCLGGPSSPTKFYTLTPVAGLPAAGPPPAGGDGGVTVGVGPVTLPAYLDRPQIVTRRSPDELDLSDFDRWAGPLDDNIERVLAQDLATLLRTDRVALFPWPVSRSVPRQIVVDMLRFDGSLGGEVVLDARWRVVANDGKELVLKRSTLSEATGGQGYGTLVAAMSRALAGLSRDIAAALRELPR